MFHLISHGYNVPETEIWGMPLHILLERQRQYVKKDKDDAKNQPTCPLFSKKG